MDGIHDMGGMHGFGQIPIDDKPGAFQTPWQGRMFANNIAMLISTGGNIDRFRYLVECMDPADYLASSYYERWLTGLLAAAVELDILDESQVEAIQAGQVPPVEQADVEALPPDIAHAMVDYPARNPIDRTGVGQFAVGDPVRAKMLHLPGHNRLPRYARGRCGTVVSDNGNHFLADVRAEDGTILMQRMYTVAFSARELWGESAHPADSVRVDLWESYLEPT